MTLVVRAPTSRSAERRYVLDVVLTEWLGLDYELQTREGPGVSILSAGDPEHLEIALPDALFGCPDEDWLSERSMPVQPLQRLDAGPDAPGGAPLPVIFGEAAAAGPMWRRTATGLESQIDLLGSVFFCLTRYEEMVRSDRDRHARFPASASLAAREGFLDRPIVDEYVDELWNGLHALWPSLVRRPAAFRLRLTHDVDEPWAILGRRGEAVAHALAGDLLRRRDARLAGRRLRALVDAGRGRVDRDPYNTFDLLMATSELHGLRSVFYFLAEPDPAAEAPYRLTDPPIVALLRRIHERGHEVGLHAGYESHLSPQRTMAESSTLKAACRAAGFDQPTWGVRQHYLRFDNPRTWRNHEAAGFEHDSTLGYADDVGFRAGTCREYPTFDLLEARRLELRERPLVVMDATLLVYLGLDPDAAAERARAIVAACRRHQGDAVLLYHNSTLAGSRLRDHYTRLVADLARPG
jgi:hypothetical protein